MEGCSSSHSEDLSEVMQQFCAVTGASQELAQPLLEACNWNLQMAIGMHMDGGVQAQGSAENRSGAEAPAAEDDVRAPIPQRREVLVDQQAFVPTGRRRGARSVFDSFRDFQAETKQAEERVRRGEPLNSGPPRKRHTLEDLFRPPVDLIHKGSFHSAKEAGTAANRWILVNIQNVKEFNCQVLNRDVWSNSMIRDIIDKHFLFWQVYSDSEDGKRYMQFYNIHQWPYMAIIDPQTGEKFIEWNSVEMKAVLELMNNFLAEHPCPDNSVEAPPAKKAKMEDSIVDASEDSQLAAAIKASLKSTTPATSTATISISSDSEDCDSTDGEDLETFSDSGSDSGSTTAQTKDSRTSSDGRNVTTISSATISDCETNSEKGDLSVAATSRESSSSRKRKLEHTSVTGPRSRVKNTSKNHTKSAHPVNNGVCQETVSLCSTDESSSLTISSEESRESTASSSAVTQTSWRDYLGNENDDKTRLLLRYPDGKREPFSIPRSSKLRAVLLYVSENDINLEEHELVTNFPRRKISDMNMDQTLEEAGLHPQETIFVQTIS